MVREYRVQEVAHHSYRAEICKEHPLFTASVVSRAMITIDPGVFGIVVNRIYPTNESRLVHRPRSWLFEGMYAVSLERAIDLVRPFQPRSRLFHRKQSIIHDRSRYSSRNKRYVRNRLTLCYATDNDYSLKASFFMFTSTLMSSRPGRGTSCFFGQTQDVPQWSQHT